MKNKNPLYVVKGNTVLEAQGVFDLVLKKFNLDAAYQVLKSIIELLLRQVNSYPAFLAVKGMIDRFLETFALAASRFGLA